MKLYTYQTPDNAARLGAGFASHPGLIWPLEAFGLSFSDMNELIRAVTLEELTKRVTDTAAIAAEKSALTIDMKQSEQSDFAAAANNEGIAAATKVKGRDALSTSNIRLLAPIPHPAQDILCLGINYAAHAEESARFHKDAFLVNRKKAVYFSKRVTEAIGAGDIIPRHADLTESLDYEVELAVVIGKDCRNVSVEEAADYIFGYTIMNDVSARDLQTDHIQWYFGKSLDGFTPMGPCIVTADEFPFPPALKISSYVNGDLRQNSSTDYLIHSIPEIIAELSSGMTLKAGTIIATGTPAGVGMGTTPPRFLHGGDVVTCRIEGIGELTNTVSK